MRTIKLNLSDLLTSQSTDNISGRLLGEKYAEDNRFIEHVLNKDKIVIMIDSNKIKAINNSFIKGVFSNVVKKLHSKENVYNLFTIDADDYYKRLFDKNLTLLEAINNI